MKAFPSTAKSGKQADAGRQQSEFEHGNFAASTALFQPQQILQLQKTIGNRAVQRMLSASLAARQRAVAPTSTPVVQRQIQLVDADAAVYQEMEAEQYASDKGELYFTGSYNGSHPIFVSVDLIEKFREEFENTKIKRKQEEILDRMREEAVFITAQGEFKGAPGFMEQHYLSTAFKQPVLRNTSHKGGMGFRYAAAKGKLVSWKTKEEVEQEIKKIPDNVVFEQIPAADWYHVVMRNSTDWTEINKNYAYRRDVSGDTGNLRDDTSKFRQGKNSEKTDTIFKDDQLKTQLPPVKGDFDSTWIDYKAAANYKDREEGQYKAMSNWNALAYAAYMKHHGHADKVNLEQDWEWLHVRGAQNGGTTNADNLMAGTSSTNSRMIPWENSINDWTKLAKPKYPLSVRFEGKRVPDTNLGQKITISVAAENGIPNLCNPVPKESPMKLEFNPLSGNVFDKLSEKLTSHSITKDALNDSSTAEKTKMVLYINAGHLQGKEVEVLQNLGKNAQIRVLEDDSTWEIDKKYLSLKYDSPAIKTIEKIDAEEEE